MSLKMYCQDRADIEQDNGVPDGQGGVPHNWQVKYPAIRCRFIPESFDVIDRYSGRQVKQPAHVVIPNAQLTITPRDRLRLTKCGDLNVAGQYYRVIEVHNPHLQNRFLDVHVERWE